jgi:co-chaperonin GroES (HSP10)
MKDMQAGTVFASRPDAVSYRPPTVPPPQEDDVIGTLSGGEDISKLQPLQDRVLIEVMQAASATTGGLLLTEGSKDKPTMGKVVAVGPGRAPEEEDKPTVAPKVEVGATVLYQKYSGTEVSGFRTREWKAGRGLWGLR